MFVGKREAPLPPQEESNPPAVHSDWSLPLLGGQAGFGDLGRVEGGGEESPREMGAVGSQDSHGLGDLGEGGVCGLELSGLILMLKRRETLKAA